LFPQKKYQKILPISRSTFIQITEWCSTIKTWARNPTYLPSLRYQPYTFIPSSCNLAHNCGNSTSRTTAQKSQALTNYQTYKSSLNFPHISVYTDGSVLKNQETCACGIFIQNPTHEFTAQFVMIGNITTGETYAFTAALLMLDLLHLSLPIYIYTDSYNAFQNSFNPIRIRTAHPTIINYLKTKLLFHDTHLASHCNIPYNDYADTLAADAHYFSNPLNCNSLIELKQSLLQHFQDWYQNTLHTHLTFNTHPTFFLSYLIINPLLVILPPLFLTPLNLLFFL